MGSGNYKWKKIIEVSLGKSRWGVWIGMEVDCCLEVGKNEMIVCRGIDDKI